MNAAEAIDKGHRKQRCFLALKTPSAWDEKLGELQRNLKSKFGSSAFRWVKPEQIHITLRFFGWITTIEASELTELLPSICSRHDPFTLTCESLGTFPNSHRPRVLWAGLKGDLDRASALQNDITGATRRLGEPPEDRPFKPHLTLARLKDPNQDHVTDLEDTVRRGFQIDQPWRITEVLLMESHLSPQGSSYETVAKFHLGA
jgi:2'-5' RNA ligase